MCFYQFIVKVAQDIDAGGAPDGADNGGDAGIGEGVVDFGGAMQADCLRVESRGRAV